jgi:hypothetical protein
MSASEKGPTLPERPGGRKLAGGLNRYRGNLAEVPVMEEWRAGYDLS